MLKLKLAMWDAALEAEELLDAEIDTCDSDYLCSGLDTTKDVDRLTDATLIEVFRLEPAPRR